MVSPTTGSSVCPKLELARKLGTQALAENYASKQHHHLAGTKEAYRQQIEDAQRDHLSNELLMAAIEAYKLEQKDAIVEQLKKELQPIVLADLYHNLHAEVLQQLKAEHLNQVVGELKAENRETVIGMLKNDLRMAVKNRLERSLPAEIRQELEPVIAHTLREELRPVIAEELRQEMTRLPSPSERAPSSSHYGPPLSAASDSPRGRKRHRDGSSAPLPSANDNALFFSDANAEDKETSAGPPQGIKRRRSSSPVRGDEIRRRFVEWSKGRDKPAFWDDVALEEWSGGEEENGEEEEGEGGEEDDGEEVEQAGDVDEDEDEGEEGEDEDDEDEYDEEDAVEVKNEEQEMPNLGGSSNEVIDLISSDEE